MNADCLEKAGQQVIILEGIEKLPKIPYELTNRVHSDFMPPLNYGPMD